MNALKWTLAVVAAAAVAATAAIEFAPGQALQAAIAVDRWRSGLTRKEIVLEDGLRYVYLEGGSGEPLLVLHGFGASKDHFTPVARYLTPRYHLIIPDHIGFGESSHPQDIDYAPPAQAARLHALVRALGIGSLHVAGNSMGGQIALTYTSMYPAEVRSLWLLDSGGVSSAPKSERQRIVESGGRNPLMARTTDEFARIPSFVMVKPPYVPRPLLDVMAQERIRNFDLEARIYAADVAYPVEPHIAGLATPTLILWGAQDRSHHVAAAGILHGLLPHSEVVILPDAGHLPMLEQPKRCAREYLRFRDALAQASAADVHHTGLAD
jgi:pimeloyl-ACP methyl ester carboxylesterase